LWTQPIETKKLSRLGRHRKRGSSSLIRDGEGVGFNPLEGVLCGLQDNLFYMDGRYLNLLYVDPANKHDVTIIKENEEDSV
jgi:hypothetical protein